MACNEEFTNETTFLFQEVSEFQETSHSGMAERKNRTGTLLFSQAQQCKKMTSLHCELQRELHCVREFYGIEISTLTVQCQL